MIKVLTGNEAAAYGALLCKPDVVCAYPITPQSRIPEQLAEFRAEGQLKGKFINAESEMSAVGYVIGAAMAGVRVFTATSSQGLAWMHEGLHWAAGSRLPIVMANVNRPLGAPWNLTCDQTDSLSQRDTGWMQFYCESNQEILDSIVMAYKVAEAASLPVMICLDGVYLSYLSESIDIPSQEVVDEYLPAYRTTIKVLDNRYKLYEKVPPDLVHYEQINFMKNRAQLHFLEKQSIEIADRATVEFREIFGREYPLVELYRCDEAETILIMVGSAVGTGRYVIDGLREKNFKIGLVKLRMFRPFPKKLVKDALRGRKKIVIIERSLSPGQCGIFCQEINWVLNSDQHSIPVYGFVSGLGGADITPELIERAILFAMENDPPEDEPIWLGID